ncbi:unnamed protein product [Nesidiocoris tenuis]|uniref:Uncharacterized protein n=1 Tax=Nesidiocoris tenuis TaxID=355587 RepID=A0A6H5GDU7_9HEMI|nr:unnamed protein product [Nesidiocoris tenuis]
MVKKSEFLQYCDFDTLDKWCRGDEIHSSDWSRWRRRFEFQATSLLGRPSQKSNLILLRSNRLPKAVSYSRDDGPDILLTLNIPALEGTGPALRNIFPIMRTCNHFVDIRLGPPRCNRRRRNIEKEADSIVNLAGADSKYQQVSLIPIRAAIWRNLTNKLGSGNKQPDVPPEPPKPEEPPPPKPVVEAGKPISRSGTCRVCLKAFKPEDFSKTCGECQQKVCEDCASYSKPEDAQDDVLPRRTFQFKKFEKRFRNEGVMAIFVTDRRIQRHKNCAFILILTLTRIFILILILIPHVPEDNTKSLVAWRCSICRRRAASRAVVVGQDSTDSLLDAPVLEALTRRHSDVKIGSGLSVGGPTAGLAPPRSPELRRHSDVSPASLKELEKAVLKVQSERARQKGRSAAGSPNASRATSPSVERRPFPHEEPAAPAGNELLGENQDESWRRSQAARGRRKSRVTKQHSYDDEMKAAGAPASGPSLGPENPGLVTAVSSPGLLEPVYYASNSTLSLGKCVNPVSNIQPADKLKKKSPGLPASLPRRASAYDVYAPRGEAGVPAVSPGGQPSMAIAGPRRGSFRGGPPPDDQDQPQGGRALPGLPSGTHVWNSVSICFMRIFNSPAKLSCSPDISALRAQPRPLPVVTRAPEDAMRRQTSVQDGEAIKIVIHDVDCDASYGDYNYLLYYVTAIKPEVLACGLSVANPELTEGCSPTSCGLSHPALLKKVAFSRATKRMCDLLDEPIPAQSRKNSGEALALGLDFTMPISTGRQRTGAAPGLLQRREQFAGRERLRRRRSGTERRPAVRPPARGLPAIAASTIHASVRWICRRHYSTTIRSGTGSTIHDSCGLATATGPPALRSLRTLRRGRCARATDHFRKRATWTRKAACSCIPTTPTAAVPDEDPVNPNKLNSSRTNSPGNFRIRFQDREGAVSNPAKKPKEPPTLRLSRRRRATRRADGEVRYAGELRTLKKYSKVSKPSKRPLPCVGSSWSTVKAVSHVRPISSPAHGQTNVTAPVERRGERISQSATLPTPTIYDGNGTAKISRSNVCRQRRRSSICRAMRDPDEILRSLKLVSSSLGRAASIKDKRRPSLGHALGLVKVESGLNSITSIGVSQPRSNVHHSNVFQHFCTEPYQMILGYRYLREDLPSRWRPLASKAKNPRHQALQRAAVQANVALRSVRHRMPLVGCDALGKAERFRAQHRPRRSGSRPVRAPPDSAHHLVVPAIPDPHFGLRLERFSIN